MKLPRMMVTMVMTAPLLVALGCAGPTVAVNHDLDRSADFASLRGYAWLPQPAGHGFLDARVRGAVDGQLAAKGYAPAPGAPDFFVAYHVAARDRIDVEQWGYGYGRVGRTTRVEQYTEGTLVLDVIDAHSMQLLWRGYARGTVDPDASPQEREQRLNDAVAKLLAPFPASRRYAANR